MGKNRDKLKFKKLRVFLSVLRDILKGWTWNISIQKVDEITAVNFKYTLSEFVLPIKNRANLASENKNRITNMKLACNLIDRSVLYPGKIFSFKSIIGEALAEKGYKYGPVIIKGELFSSLGGGLCQISTVLFNAALLSNMKILEKYNHSTDIWREKRLINLGLDAVYVYALKDLKFKNTLSVPVLIRISVDDSERNVVCFCYSPFPKEGNVILKTKIENVIIKKKNSNITKVNKSFVKRVTTFRYFKLKNKKELNYSKEEYYS